MKTFRIILSLVLFTGFFLISKPASASGPGKGDVSFVITNHTTQAQLDSLQKALAVQGIDLSFDMVIFNSSREVKRISGSIVFSPTLSGTFSNDNMGTVSVTRKGKSMKIVSKDPNGK